jgi:hypothetical protein
MRDFIKGNEKEIGKSICHFANLYCLTLVIGDGREDARACDKDHHLKMIRKFMELYWRKYHPGRKYPRVEMYVIAAEKARIMGIDDVTW